MSSENIVTISKQNLCYIFKIQHLHVFINNPDMQTEIIPLSTESKQYWKSISKL